MSLAKRVLVVGLGRSGRAAAKIAVASGARVVGVDLRSALAPIPGVRLELGPHRRQTFLDADQIIVSPGVPASQADLVVAQAAGVPIVGELAFAASQLNAPMAAVTGTNGKSTVTWFCGQLLEAAGFKTFVGGNLGRPLCEAIGGGYERLVVEVSSYQLEWPGALQPEAAVALNLTEDHLGRHGDMATYGAVKCRLFDQMAPEAVVAVPRGQPLLADHVLARPGVAWLGELPGVRRQDRVVEVDLPGIRARLSLEGFQIPGAHNLDNAAAAALLALALGAPLEAVQAKLVALAPLAHRMEVVGSWHGVRWINDSKATNIDAARVGVGGLEAPGVVLLGGQAKGPGFRALAPLLSRQRAVICFGGSGPSIAEELLEAGVASLLTAGLADAIEVARRLAQPGDTVLLSPGCASFDEFDDFEHRGRVFSTLAAQEEP